MKKTTLNDLNQKQNEAVRKELQPVLVLAGPGTGKTRLLVTRIAWLIDHKSIQPEKILALTFTNKAATEMTNRLVQLCGQKGKDVWSGTIHSFALSLLRRYHSHLKLKADFAVCDREYQEKLLKKLMTGFSPDDLEKRVKGILLSFSNHQMKNKQLPPFAAEKYKAYISYLKSKNVLDFNQIITFCFGLLRDNPDILSEYRYLYDAILVDEFQDTDPVQYEIIKMLAMGNKNIFVVADDDQSIYAWRGANPQNIERFREDFDINEVIFLDQNYRSGKKIVDTAKAIIENTDRVEPDKYLKEVSDKTDQVSVCFFQNEKDEIEFIFDKIVLWHEKGIPYAEMAILYPFHKIGAQFEHIFLQKRLPYQMADRNSLMDHPVIQKIVYYLQVIKNPDDDIVLEDLAVSELGVATTNMLKFDARRNSMSFRQALYKYYRKHKSETDFDTYYNIKNFVTRVASLVNLKNFYTFSRLMDEIYIGVLSHQKSYLEEVSEKLEAPPDIDEMSWHKNSIKNLYIYHENPKIAFLAMQLTEKLMKLKTELYDRNSTKNETVLALSVLPQEKNIIPVYRLAGSARQGALSNLFKFMQGVLISDQVGIMQSFVILDIETTDGHIDSCDIVELAAVKFKNGAIIDQFHTLLKPRVKISAQAEKVHHISPEMVQDAPYIEQCWKNFRKFIADEILIAHNGYNFDFAILDRFARKIDGHKLANLRLDTLPLARSLFPDKGNSVDALMKRYGVKAQQRHRALDDVLVLAEIFKNLQHDRARLIARSSLNSFTDIVAAGNYIENKMIAAEDRIFFIDGARRLLSPFSNVLQDLCHKFQLDDVRLRSGITEHIRKIAPAYQIYDKKENLVEKIKMLAAQYNHLPVDEAIAAFLSYVSLNQAQDQLENIDAVSLLTYYAAKGLEFEKVFLVGLENNNMPAFHSLRDDPEDDRPVSKKLEEQRRLFYVGLTRSKSEAIITAVKNRGGFERESSEFLKNLKVEKIINIK